MKHACTLNILNTLPKKTLISLLFLSSCILFSQGNRETTEGNIDKSDDRLLYQYIQSKGNNTITFDTSNIKQFWIDHSVLSKEKAFEILLNSQHVQEMESIPLKIQLANVNVSHDCVIEIITDSNDFKCQVLNNNMQVISTPSLDENFLKYNIFSAVFHLSDTTGLSFYLKFSSRSSPKISIKKIILSFTDNTNSDFLISPGVLKITGNNIQISGKAEVFDKNESSFSISGKNIVFFSRKKIIATNKDVKNTVKVKNIGKKPTTIYMGYAPYTEKGQNINCQNNPYKNNKVLNVTSSEANDNRVNVDTYPEWEKGCCLVLDAKEDLSDFPNYNFVNGKIVDVKETNEGAEITLDSPLNKVITKGSKVRIQSKPGSTYLYTNSKLLSPGEEVTLSSSINKDESSLQFSPKAFCKGTFYYIPVFLSFPSDSNDENIILLISDYIVSY